MLTNPVARKVVQAEFAALRTSLTFADRLAHRYSDEGSMIRIPLARGVSTLDAAADKLLGTSTDAGQHENAAHTGHAEAPASTAESTSPTTGEEGIDPAGEFAPPDTEEQQREERERVAAALRLEQEEAPLVGELAEADVDARERMADLRAKHLVEEFEEAQRAKRARLDEQTSDNSHQ